MLTDSLVREVSYVNGQNNVTVQGVVFFQDKM